MGSNGHRCISCDSVHECPRPSAVGVPFASRRGDGAVASIREHGYVIIDELVASAAMDRLEAELDPHLEKSPYGTIRVRRTPNPAYRFASSTVIGGL
jgi:hypothetical protein